MLNPAQAAAIGAVLAASCWASIAASPAPAPAHTPAHASAHASTPVDTISRHAIIYLQAAQAELERLRDSIPADDFEVMADHLMYYRSTAYDLLARIWPEVVTLEGRRPLAFVVDGEVREYSFADHTTLDLIVVYRPGREPEALAPIDVERVPVYFGGTRFPPVPVSEERWAAISLDGRVPLPVLSAPGGRIAAVVPPTSEARESLRAASPTPRDVLSGPLGDPSEEHCVSQPDGDWCTLRWPGMEAVYQWENQPPGWIVHAVEIESPERFIEVDGRQVRVGDEAGVLREPFPLAYDEKREQCSAEGCRDLVTVGRSETATFIEFSIDPESGRIDRITLRDVST
jgi:hypothetical protein